MPFCIRYGNWIIQLLHYLIQYNIFGVQCLGAVSGYKFNGQIQQLEERSMTVTEGDDDGGTLLFRSEAGLLKGTLDSYKRLRIFVARYRKLRTETTVQEGS